MNRKRTLTRRRVICGALLAVTCHLVLVETAPAQDGHFLPLVPAADRSQEGFVRIINRSAQPGTVDIHAIDDTGERFGPATLSLEARETRHFNSGDLENGSARKKLSPGVGDGEGDWRLELETELDIEPLAYIRTPDGFVTSMHDLVARRSMRHHVVFFNPGDNSNQRSSLRLINSSENDSRVVISGMDDNGDPPPGENIRFTLEAGAALSISAQELEEGSDDFMGSFGNGHNKWQLFVSADQPIHVMSLLDTPEGHLTNLSTTTRAMSSPEITEGNGSGTYAYKRSGRNRGTVVVASPFAEAMDAESLFCTLSLEFTSTTTGSVTTRRAVDTSTDFAPPDRTAFEELFDEVRDPYRFSGGRFQGADGSGSYDYRKLWPNAAALRLAFDGAGASVERCTVVGNFESAISGRMAVLCNDVYVCGRGDPGSLRCVASICICEDLDYSTSSWELSSEPESFAPSDLAAFNNHCVGRRLILSPDAPPEDDSEYYIDFVSNGVFTASTRLLESRFCRGDGGSWDFRIQ